MKTRPSKLDEKILALLQSSPSRTLKTKDIARLLSIGKDDYQALRKTLKRLVGENKISCQKSNRYGAIARSAEKEGVLKVHSLGYGFVLADDGSEAFVSSKNMATALHLDRVRIRLFAVSEGQRPEGQVIAVLERARSSIVGTFRFGRRYAYVVPDDIKIQVDIVISSTDEHEVQEGQKVVVVIEEWEHPHLNPVGRIVRVLGFPDDPGVDVLSIACSYGMDATFPSAVEREAEELSRRKLAEEKEKRLDFREKLIVTIDPADAKDFDDAISLEKISDDRFQLGVHIADVAFFVPEGSALDREALARGTSVYLVDRVIPMLPHQLSTDVCSLREGEERLCYSVLIDIDLEANVHAFRVCETVIQSTKRLTYEEAQELIEGEKSDSLAETLRLMHHLSQALIRQRSNRGAIDFDSLEVKVDLDEQGRPVHLHPRERLESHRLIEEFMLLANECVARLGGQILPKEQQRSWPFVYRVHEKPDRESVRSLIDLMEAFQIPVEMPSKITPRFFQNLSSQLKDHPARTILQDALIRTMMKAKYTTEPLGHFGLAYRYYSHFTSPIRRYPDLLTHRLLKAFQQNGTVPALEIVEKKCQQSSENEIRALEAERASIKLKQVEFIERHLNESFEGIVSRIVNFGIFVQIPQFLIDGLIHISDLADDYYLVDEKNYCLLGQSSGRKFRLGDRLRVRVARVSRAERLVDFLLAESEDEKK